MAYIRFKIINMYISEDHFYSFWSIIIWYLLLASKMAPQLHINVIFLFRLFIRHFKWDIKNTCMIRGVIDKFVSFIHRIIYGWIYTIFCHYQRQSVVNRKKTLKCKVRQTCDVTMMLMTPHVGNVVVKMLEDRCGWCTLSGYKWCSTSAIIVKFSDNICA